MSAGTREPRRLALLVAGLLVALAVVSVVHVAQGTALVGAGDVLAWLTGRADEATSAVIESSRLPRVVAGLVVGVTLGATTAVMQSVSRNVLASPDTLAVNQGAFLALTLVATTGVTFGVLGGLVTAFAGGMVAAAVVLVLAGGEAGTVRLVLAGIVVGQLAAALATALIIMDPFAAQGLFAWSAGSLSQNGFGSLVRLGPVMLAGLLLAVLLSRRLDLLALGEDKASSLGVPVRRTQLLLVVLTVMMCAAAVTVTGPIGYAGLVAAAGVRLLAPAVPGLGRHRALVPVAGLAGAVLLLSADVLVRALLGAQQSVEVPTGVATSLLGGLVLVLLAVRLRASTLGGGSDSLDVRGAGLERVVVLVLVLVAVLAAVLAAAVLVGDRMLLPGDLVVWAQGRAGPVVSGVMETRAPRVVAAALAGAALALAGAVIQGVTRNPLADAGIIGVASGASLVGVLVVVLLPGAPFTVLSAGAGLGAVLAGLVVFGLTASSGFASDRLILVGVGLATLCDAAVTMVIVATDPYNEALALTWLSGSTYGRVYEHLVPLVLALLGLVPLVLGASRRLDLLSVDDDLPRVLGLRLTRDRPLLLGAAVLLTGAAVAAIGPLVFVGLVAPHAARVLVGRRHARVLPVAALLGAVLVVLGDLLGRSLMAPVQLPAGLLTAVLGAPYFLWLMWQGRRQAALR